MNRIPIYILSLLFLCACHEEELQPAPIPDTVQVEFSVQPEAVQIITRATDETGIADVNLYLFSRYDAKPLHLYTASPHICFSCTPGDYVLYIVANRHADMGELTEKQLEECSFTYLPDTPDQILSSRAEIRIEAAPKTVTLPPVEVKRALARIDYRITVAPAVGDIRLRSVSICNIPRRGYLFGEHTPSAVSSDYTAAAPVHLSEAQQNEFSATFYMPENRQGVVFAITSQEQKNRDNAPAFASYLRIRALRGTKVLDYYVYLGENNTDDFNIRRNTRHTLDIRILGDELMDFRVRSYTVEVAELPMRESQDGFQTERLSAQLAIRLSGDYEQMGIHAVLELHQGDPQIFFLNGHPDIERLPIDLSSGQQQIALDYRPDSFTAENASLYYTLTLYDRYGEVRSYDFRHTFAYVLQVYTTWHNGPRQLWGRISSPDALAVVEHNTLSATYSMVYCTAEGCMLVAITDEGHAFDVWCTYQGHAGELSYDERYFYVPAESLKTIYAFFR